VATGACTALLALAIWAGLSSTRGPVEPAAAAEVLREAAKVAATRRPLRPGPHQYLFTRSKSAYLLDSSAAPACKEAPCEEEARYRWSVLEPTLRESWISLDGSRKGRIREVHSRPRFVSASQRARWIAVGSPPLAGPRVSETTISGGPALDPQGLPTEPAALRRAIEARSIPGVEGPPGEAETFSLIGELLRDDYLPAAVRSALYLAAAELPGVESLGEVRDPVGRRGVGIAFVDRRRAVRQVLILDPATAVLLGERETMTGGRLYGFSAPVGTTIGWAAYLESKVVDSVGRHATPGAGSFDDSIGCYETASLHASVAILHGRDPLATCAGLWRRGEIGTRLRRLEAEGKIAPDPRRSSPHLVACTEDGTPALVFPASGPQICRHLGLRVLDLDAWRAGG
jgi:hypothetical protein